MVTGKPHNGSSSRLLACLAESYGVQTRYRHALGGVCESSQDSLLLILAALGADVDGPGGLAGAVLAREAEKWGRLLEPVVVAWEGRLPGLTLRLPAGAVRGGGDRVATIRLELTLEEGGVLGASLALEQAATVDEATVGDRRYLAVAWNAGAVGRAFGPAGRDLPWGYHRLRVETAGGAGATGGAGAAGAACEALVISAPRRCWEVSREGGAAAQRGSATGGCAVGGAAPAGHTAGPLDILAGRRWGLFAPVYALRSARDYGAGDLRDLERLLDWTGERGGSLLATLPLLASDFGPDADPSPYRPLSRLFWNEFYLAPERLPEWGLHREVRALGESRAARVEQQTLRLAEYVDYKAVMALKRPVLAEAARRFFECQDDVRWADYRAFLDENPAAEDYASFRADWAPAPELGRIGGAGARARRGGQDDAGPRGESDREQLRRYHLYCQWQMDRQLAVLAGAGRPGLLFDLPLGVHPDSFDVARFPGSFAGGMSTGAPPDPFFAKGQDWDTPPLDAWADRRDGYPYFRACLRTLMRHAAALRVDHVMGFHRLFWIPEGMDAKDGAYVGYPADDLYAVLSCESNLSHTEVVGEDLGTVPLGVRAAMRSHAVARTSVFLGALRPRAADLAAPMPPDCVATLETHDMVPLAGFLHGDDIQVRVETGQLDPDAARSEYAARAHLVARLAEDASPVPAAVAESARPVPEAEPSSILAGCLARLAHSAARMVLVNLEDLLLERRPQNVPGTGSERPNWRRKIAVPLEGLSDYINARR